VNKITVKNLRAFSGHYCLCRIIVTPNINTPPVIKNITRFDEV